MPIIGNVYKHKNRLYVVIDCQNDFTVFIPFDASNSVHYIKEKPETKEVPCVCQNTYGLADTECESCSGKGIVTKTRPSLQDYKFVASTIREYLIKKYID